MSRIAAVVTALAVATAVATAARATEADREAVRKAITAELAHAPLAGARVGIAISSLEDGTLVYTHDADALLNPASNVKLFTSAAALARLGPEYRFTTEFSLDKAIRGGVAPGNLYVKGRGDPTLTLERLYSIASGLVHRGLHRVSGDLVLDASFFDADKAGPGWEQETSDKSYAAFVAPLSVAKNAVTIYVTPGDRPGQRARVELDPDCPAVVLDNRVVTAPATGRKRIVPHTEALADGRTRVIVSGRLPLKRQSGEPLTLVFTRRISEPARFAGEVMKSVFARRGLTVRGKIRLGAAPAGTPFYTAESASLAEVVREMNKVSSNFDAEMILKTLGAEQGGAPGTWPKGVEIVEQFLAEVGVPRGSYVMKNGSGLNDTNRFSARQVTSLLGDMSKRFTFAADYLGSLGIAGRDGTVRLRMEGTEAVGRIRAKTGTLESVSALSGYAQAVGGEKFVFSILVNDINGGHAPVVAAIDRLGAAIAAEGAPNGPAQAVAELKPDAAALPELKARVSTYEALARLADKRNLPFLRTALRTERDPVLKAVVADALFQSDPDSGGALLLDAFQPTPEIVGKLRAVGAELQLPVPVVNSLIDLAAEGNADALSRLIALAPLARGDSGLEAMLEDGFCEIGRTAPDELIAALTTAGDASKDALELAGRGINAAADKADHPLLKAVKARVDAGLAPAQAILSGIAAGMEAAQHPPPKCKAGTPGCTSDTTAPAPTATPVEPTLDAKVVGG